MSLLHHVEDPRNGFQKFRRNQLYYIAKRENVPHPQDAPATTMYAILADSGVDPNKYRNLLVPDAVQGNMTQRVEVKVPEVKVTPKTDWTTLSVPALRKIARERGIKFEMTTKKLEFLKLLDA